MITSSNCCLQGVIKYGVTNFKDIKQKMEVFRKEWSETEIRLRICRLFKVYNLKPYEGRQFSSKEEILEEAAKNKKEALRTKKAVGGILYNPVAEQEDAGIMGSYFNVKNNKVGTAAASQIGTQQ